MTTYKWVVDPAHPSGYAVPLTPAEQAQYDADQIAGAAVTSAWTTGTANAQTMRQALVTNMQTMVDLAALVQGGTATPAQKDAALVHCLRGCVRLSRLVLELYDVAA